MTTTNNQTKLSLAAYPNPSDDKNSHLETLLGDSPPQSPERAPNARKDSKKIKKLDSLSIVNNLKTAEYLLPEGYRDLKTLKEEFRAKADERMKKMQESQELVKCHGGKGVQ